MQIFNCYFCETNYLLDGQFLWGKYQLPGAHCCNKCYENLLKDNKGELEGKYHVRMD